jgi:hypothetical protein
LLHAEAPLGAADIAHDATDVLADPLIEDRLPRHLLEAMPLSIMAKRPVASWVEPTRTCRPAGNVNAPQIRDEFLRQPDTANVRTGSVTNLHEVLLVRSIATHGTIAHPVEWR